MFKEEVMSLLEDALNSYRASVREEARFSADKGVVREGMGPLGDVVGNHHPAVMRATIQTIADLYPDSDFARDSLHLLNDAESLHVGLVALGQREKVLVAEAVAKSDWIADRQLAVEASSERVRREARLLAAKSGFRFDSE